jgi:hypothetical protein
LGGGGGVGVPGVAWGGGGGGAALCAGAGAGAAAGPASGAGAGVGGGAAWAVAAGSAAGAEGAGVLLHPPRSSNPVNPIDSMPPREYAIRLCLWPLVECSGLKNACIFMILSVNFLFCIAIAKCGFSLGKAAAELDDASGQKQTAFARAVTASSAQTQKPKLLQM